MTTKLLTKDDYEKILQKKFKTNNIKFKQASYVPLSENIEGFVGDHYILQITYKLNNEEKTENFFVKTQPTKTEIQRTIVNEMNVYQKEIFLYEYLFTEYKKYGYNTSFAPKSYFCKPYETIVLENLKLRNYILYPRKEFYDLNHCKLSLKALAQYHANAISYEETKSKELGKTFKINDYKPEVFNEIFYKENDKDAFVEKFIKSTINCYVAISDVMDKPEEWKKNFQQRLHSLNLPKLFNKELPYRKTCCHGDLWSNNMLFKYTNGKPTHCILVDYQLLRYHHPSFDVMLIIYSNTTRQFRKQNFNELLNYYYDTFEEILKKHGFEAKFLLPKEHFLKAADELKIVALMQGASTRLMTLLPPNILTDAVNDGSTDLEKMMFGDKSEIILENCKKYDDYKKSIYDGVYDLDEII